MRLTTILILALAGTAAAADAVPVVPTNTEAADSVAITAATDATLRRELDARYGRVLRVIRAEIDGIEKLIHADESAYPDAVYIGAVKALREAERDVMASYETAIGRSAASALNMMLICEHPPQR